MLEVKSVWTHNCFRRDTKRMIYSGVWCRCHAMAHLFTDSFPEFKVFGR